MNRSLSDFFCNARFELLAQIRRPTVYVATALLLLYWTIFASRLRMEANFWGPSGGVYCNAPAVLYFTLSAQAFVTFLLIPIFLGSSALRDRQAQIAEPWLATPVSPLSALWGRFFAGFSLLASSTFLAGFGIVLSPYFRSAIGKAAVVQTGPVPWMQLLEAWLILLVPTMFSASAFVYWLVVKTRRSSAAIAATTVFVLGAVISHYLGKSLHSDFFDLIDPTGIHAVHSIIAFWTVEQRNHSFLPLSDLLVMNRLLWLMIALGFSAWSCASFRRSHFLFGASRARRKKDIRHDKDVGHAERATQSHHSELESRSLFPWQLFLTRLKVELSRLVKEPLFNVVLVFFFLWLFAQHAGSMEIGLVRRQPTANLLLKARGGLWMLVFYFVPFLTATSVFSERRLPGSEYLDALPIPNSLIWLPKLGAVVIYCLIFPILVVATSLFTHLIYSGESFDAISFVEVLTLSYYPFVLQIVLLAFTIASLCQSRPMAYGLTMLVLYVGIFVYETASVPHEIALQMHETELTWSSFDRIAPYREKVLSKSLFWLLGSLCALTMATAYWKRGSLSRGKQALWRWRGPLACFLFVLSGLVFKHATEASEDWSGTQLRPKLHSERAEYERRFSEYRSLSSPAIESLELRLEFLPVLRAFEYSWQAKIQSSSQAMSNELFLQCGLNQDIDLFADDIGFQPRRSLPEFGVHFFRLPESSHGERLSSLRVEGAHRFRGHPRHRDNPLGVGENGSYLGAGALPRFGYDPSVELSLGVERRKHELGPRAVQNPSVAADCQWADFATPWKLHLVTDSNQYAVGPGHLEREWKQEGRNHFVYASERPDCSYFAFASARYSQVDAITEPRPGQKIRLRLLFNPAGKARVENLLSAAEYALSSLQASLGDYPYSSLQVVQVRDDADLGVSPANTVFLRDSEGWLDRIESAEDEHNLLFFITKSLAQHWSHNLLAPARAPGSGLFSQAIPTYYANRVVEEKFGTPWFNRNYLTRAFRRYFRYHGINATKEVSVSESGDSEHVGSIKGALALRELAREIGKDAFDARVRGFIRKEHSSTTPATAGSLLESLRSRKRDKTLFDEMVEEIVHYDNRLESATASSLPNGGYRLALSIHASRLLKDTSSQYPRESPWKRPLFIEFSYEDRSPTTHQVELVNGKNVVEMELDKLPVKATIDPEFRLLDFSLKDQSAKVKMVHEDVVLAR